MRTPIADIFLSRLYGGERIAAFSMPGIKFLSRLYGGEQSQPSLDPDDFFLSRLYGGELIY